MSPFEYFSTPTVGERKTLAARKIQQLRANGREIDPVEELQGRKIATSFWGAAWCQHLESYSDYETRLPRGRTYVRTGSVLHLGMEPGVISALVQGSELYEEKINIQPLPVAKWERIQAKCRGKISSLIELLQGKISDEIMKIVTDKNDGLFPSPREIRFSCSCPDHADMCKHIAAVLYGVGVRLDTRPELLFKLRGVDHNTLISVADTTASLAARPAGSKGRRRLSLAPGTALADIFGAEIEPLEIAIASQPVGVAEEVPAPVSVSAAPTLPVETEPAPPEPERPPVVLHYMSRKDIRDAVLKREKEAIARLKAQYKANPKPPRTTPFVHTGNTVRALRHRLDLSHERLAKKLKVSLNTVQRWEDNRDKPLILREPGRTNLEALEAEYPEP